MRRLWAVVGLAACIAAGCESEQGEPADAPLSDGAAPDNAALADGAADMAPSDGAPPEADAGAAGPAQPATDFTLTLGLGAQHFTPVQHGGVALLQRGCQGAQHVWISLRSPDLAPGSYLMTLSAERADDGAEAVPAHDLEFDWVDAEAGGAELVGVTLVVFDPLAVVDADVDVMAEVQAGDGRVGRAVRRIRVEWGPDDC